MMIYKILLSWFVISFAIAMVLSYRSPQIVNDKLEAES